MENEEGVKWRITENGLVKWVGTKYILRFGSLAFS